MDRDDIVLYAIIAAVILFLLGFLAFWFYSEYVCVNGGCYGGGGP